MGNRPRLLDRRFAPSGDHYCRNAQLDEGKATGEAREVPAGSRAEGVLCFVEFSQQEGSCGACAVDVVEDRRGLLIG